MHALVGAGLALPGGPGRTLREHYQTFSEWVDTKNAQYQARADARNAPPPPQVDPLMANGFAWFRSGASQAEAAARFQREFGMDRDTARETARRVHEMWGEALKEALGVKDTPGTPEPPPASGSGSGVPPLPPGPKATAGGARPSGPRPGPAPTGGASAPTPPGGPLVPAATPGDPCHASVRPRTPRKNAPTSPSGSGRMPEIRPMKWSNCPAMGGSSGPSPRCLKPVKPSSIWATLAPSSLSAQRKSAGYTPLLRKGAGRRALRRLPSRSRLPSAGPRPRPSRRTSPPPQAERPAVIRLGPEGSIAPKLTQLIDQMRALGATDLEASHPDDAAKALEIFRTRAHAALRHYGTTPPTQIRPLLTQLRSALKVLNAHWDTLHPGATSSTPPPLAPATPFALPPPHAQRPPPSAPPRPAVIPLGPGTPPLPPDAPELLPPSDARPALTNDPVYQQAITLVRTHDRASTAWLAQQMGLSTSKANALLQRMEDDGFVTPAQYPQPRQVIHPLAPPMPAPAVPEPSDAAFGETPVSTTPVTPPTPPSAIGALFGEEPGLPPPPVDVPRPPDLTGTEARPGEDQPTYQAGQAVTFVDPATGR